MCTDVFLNFLCILLKKNVPKSTILPNRKKARELRAPHAIHDPLRLLFRWQLTILCHLWSTKTGSPKSTVSAKTSDKKTKRSVCVYEHKLINFFIKKNSSQKLLTKFQIINIFEHPLHVRNWSRPHKTYKRRYLWGTHLQGVYHLVGPETNTQKDDNSKRQKVND